VKDELILFLKGNIRGVFEDIPEFCWNCWVKSWKQYGGIADSRHDIRNLDLANL
jgi:hypothetical protein